MLQFYFSLNTTQSSTTNKKRLENNGGLTNLQKSNTVPLAITEVGGVIIKCDSSHDNTIAECEVKATILKKGCDVDARSSMYQEKVSSV